MSNPNNDNEERKLDERGYAEPTKRIDPNDYSSIDEALSKGGRTGLSSDSKEYDLRSRLAQARQGRDLEGLVKIVDDHLKEHPELTSTRRMRFFPWVTYGVNSFFRKRQWDPSGELRESIRESLKRQISEDFTWLANTLELDKNDFVVEGKAPVKETAAEESVVEESAEEIKAREKEEYDVRREPPKF